jgi:hypothetical protein
VNLAGGCDREAIKARERTVRAAGFVACLVFLLSWAFGRANVAERQHGKARARMINAIIKETAF